MMIDELDKELESAMWSGDSDRLRLLAPCSCCCSEHTFVFCLARLWDGCRSGQPYGYDWNREVLEWQRFYEKHHGLTRDRFYGIEEAL